MHVGFLRDLLARARRPGPELAGLAALVGLVAGVTAGLARGDVGFAAMSGVPAWPDPAAGLPEATTTIRPASSSTTTTVAGQPARPAGIRPTPGEHGRSGPATTRGRAPSTTAPGTSANPIDTGPPGTVATTTTRVTTTSQVTTTSEVTTTSVAPSTTPTTATSASTTTTTAALRSTTSTLGHGDR
jgi:hypothetical protein